MNKKKTKQRKICNLFSWMLCIALLFRIDEKGEWSTPWQMKYYLSIVEYWNVSYNFVYLFLYRSGGDPSSDSKELHFQEMLLERTKALAAQAEALKSNSDGKLIQKLLIDFFLFFIHFSIFPMIFFICLIWCCYDMLSLFVF